jgi:hypothetical protein
MNYHSTLFHILYNETHPIGRFGYGTHYSVLSAVQWVDKYKKQLQLPCIQNFAIIWDEDHDKRIINVIERAYMSALLAPLLFIGERKAGLTAIVNNEFRELSQNDQTSYIRAWQNVCNKVYENSCHSDDADSWVFELRTMDDTELKIIAEPRNKVVTYLQNIKNLWNIGLNTYIHKSNYEPVLDDVFDDI